MVDDPPSASFWRTADEMGFAAAVDAGRPRSPISRATTGGVNDVVADGEDVGDDATDRATVKGTAGDAGPPLGVEAEEPPDASLCRLAGAAASPLDRANDGTEGWPGESGAMSGVRCTVGPTAISPMVESPLVGAGVSTDGGVIPRSPISCATGSGPLGATSSEEDSTGEEGSADGAPASEKAGLACSEEAESVKVGSEVVSGEDPPNSGVLTPPGTDGCPPGGGPKVLTGVDTVGVPGATERATVRSGRSGPVGDGPSDGMSEPDETDIEGEEEGVSTARETVSGLADVSGAEDSGVDD